MICRADHRRLDPPIERERDPKRRPEPSQSERQALDPDVSMDPPPQIRQQRVDLRRQMRSALLDVSSQEREAGVRD